MGFMDYLFMFGFIIVTIYCCYAGIRLMQGADSITIPYYTYLDEKDKACYDDRKVKRVVGMGYIVGGLSCPLMWTSLFVPAVIIFIAAFGIPNHLLRRTDYFIKKN